MALIYIWLQDRAHLLLVKNKQRIIQHYMKTRLNQTVRQQPIAKPVGIVSKICSPFVIPWKAKEAQVLSVVVRICTVHRRTMTVRLSHYLTNRDNIYCKKNS